MLGAACGGPIYYQIGPKRLYQATDDATNHKNTPAAMRDAIQNLTVGTRLLAIRPRIIGGEPAPAGMYPWIASIGLKGVASQDGHFCGGAFVASNWVITAAHCVNKEAANKIQVLGNTNVLSEGGTIYPVDRIVIHEKYDANTSDYDVALLHVTKRFTARPIMLLAPADADRFAASGSLAVAAGWGLTAEGASVANGLRHVTVRSFQQGLQRPCLLQRRRHRPDAVRRVCRRRQGLVPGRQWRAFDVSDSASGFYQAGIVSWGEGCGRLNKFGVYTRVSTIQPWALERSAPAARQRDGAVTPKARGKATSNSRASVPRRASSPPRTKSLNRSTDIKNGGPRAQADEYDIPKERDIPRE